MMTANSRKVGLATQNVIDTIAPRNPPIYIRISHPWQFLYLTVSMRLRILGMTELNALCTDC